MAKDDGSVQDLETTGGWGLDFWVHLQLLTIVPLCGFFMWLPHNLVA